MTPFWGFTSSVETARLCAKMLSATESTEDKMCSRMDWCIVDFGIFMEFIDYKIL